MTGFGRSLSPLAACAGLIAACALGACARQDPPLGVRGGELESCEGRSACESGAVPLGRDPGQAAARIVEHLMKRPRTQVLMNRALEGSGESYVRAKARSPLLGLWTDLEFHLDPAAKTVRYRVELRVPLLDLGATKSLATELRRALDGEL